MYQGEMSFISAGADLCMAGFEVAEVALLGLFAPLMLLVRRLLPRYLLGSSLRERYRWLIFVE
jgi:hypothetical protein